MKIYEQKYFFCKTVSPFFAYPYFSKPWPRLIKHMRNFITSFPNKYDFCISNQKWIHNNFRRGMFQVNLEF